MSSWLHAKMKTSTFWISNIFYTDVCTLSWHLFTKLVRVLLQGLVMSRSCKVRVSTFSIALKFDRNIDSSTSGIRIEFPIRSLYHPISRLRDITWFGGETFHHLVTRGPETVINPTKYNYFLSVCKKYAYTFFLYYGQYNQGYNGIPQEC